jgi:hypothetical protein
MLAQDQPKSHGMTTVLKDYAPNYHCGFCLIKASLCVFAQLGEPDGLCFLLLNFVLCMSKSHVSMVKLKAMG